MKKKFIFKISLLMLALVCAFATLGAYTWAYDYNENEKIIYSDNVYNSENNNIYITENNINSIEQCYIIIKNGDNNNIIYLCYYESEYLEEEEAFQLSFRIYTNISGKFLSNLDDTMYAILENNDKISATDFLEQYTDNWASLGNDTFYVVNGEYPQQTTQTTIYNSTCENLAEIVASFAVLLGSLFVSVAQIFYYNNALTTIGILSLVGVGVGLALWGFKYIRKLIKVRTKK